MSFLDLAAKRYSVRAYKADGVEEEKLQAVLEAARLAPTAGNRQPFQIIVIRTKGREAELKRIYPQEWFSQAPVVVGICTIPAKAFKRSDGKNYADVDATIAMDHLILAAADLGLGTCWIGAFDCAAAREVLRAPQGVEPIAFTPIGYPGDAPRPKKRKPLSDLVLEERYPA